MMEAHESLVGEINGLKDVFLLSLIENSGSLIIRMCGGAYAEPGNGIDGSVDDAIRHQLENARKVVEDTSVVYEIIFSSYVSFSVRNESYTAWDAEESFSSGNRYRMYSKSKFLDYIDKSTFASQVTKYRHFGIICADQIIDIASPDDPEIKKFTECVH